MELEERVTMLETKVAKLNDAVFGPTAEPHKVGWHLNNTAPIAPGERNVISAVPPRAILVIPGLVPPSDVAWVLEKSPDCHIFVRPYYVPSEEPSSKHAYLQTCVSLVKGDAYEFIPEGQRHLQIFNEQNMPRHSQWEGFGVNVADMAHFDDVFCDGYQRIKDADPSWLIGWTPLTPGNRDVCFHGADPANVPYYMHGLEAAKANPTQEEIQRAVLNGPCYKSLMLADEYIAHIYCMSPENQIDRDWAGLRFVMYAKFFPKPMDVWIMECGIGGEPHWICDWFQILQAYPPVKGTAIWKLGAEIGGVNPQVAALREYVLNLPPTPPQPIPWPQPIDVEPSPPPPPPPPPDLCEEALDTTDDELICIVAADFHKVLAFFHEPEHGGWSIETADQQRAVICEWIKRAGFKGEYGTWQHYMERWGCREAPPEPPEPEPPVVDFYAVPTSGIAPLAVQFINTSTGEYNSLQWDFGDGGSLTGEAEPLHVYAEPGLYAVSLTLWWGGQSYPLTKPAYIEVLPKPEPEPPAVRKFHFAASGTITLTEAGPEEPPVDWDRLMVAVVPAL